MSKFHNNKAEFLRAITAIDETLVTNLHLNKASVKSVDWHGELAICRPNVPNVKEMPRWLKIWRPWVEDL